jgi:transposase
VSGRPEEGLTDATICAARRPAGSDQSHSAASSPTTLQTFLPRSTPRTAISLPIPPPEPPATIRRRKGGAGHSIKDGAQAIGRSRGGLTTKIHVLVDALGNPVEVMLSSGQDHDLTCAEPLIEAVDPGALIADKAFDADPFIGALEARAITPVIPPKSNRKTPRRCDFALCCERNLIERFFNKLKHFRAIATRYDKLAKIFLARVQFACATILLN